MNRFDLVEATFQPKQTDNLKPSAMALIGQRLAFRALWLMDDDDPYPGQWAMGLEPAREVDWHWVPEEDLTDITEPANDPIEKWYAASTGIIKNGDRPQIVTYELYVEGKRVETIEYNRPLPNDKHHRIMEYLANRAVNDYGTENFWVKSDYEL